METCDDVPPHWCVRFFVAVLMAILISSAPICAQEADLGTAKQFWTQMSQFYQGGKPAEAIPLAKQLLAIRERILGQEDPYTAASLDDLAVFVVIGDAKPLPSASVTTTITRTR